VVTLGAKPWRSAIPRGFAPTRSALAKAAIRQVRIARGGEVRPQAKLPYLGCPTAVIRARPRRGPKGEHAKQNCKVTSITAAACEAATVAEKRTPQQDVPGSAQSTLLATGVASWPMEG